MSVENIHSNEITDTFITFIQFLAMINLNVAKRHCL